MRTTVDKQNTHNWTQPTDGYMNKMEAESVGKS